MLARLFDFVVVGVEAEIEIRQVFERRIDRGNTFPQPERRLESKQRVSVSAIRTSGGLAR